MNFKCKCENCKAEQEVNPVEVKIDEKAIKLCKELIAKKEEALRREKIWAEFNENYEVTQLMKLSYNKLKILSFIEKVRRFFGVKEEKEHYTSDKCYSDFYAKYGEDYLFFEPSEEEINSAIKKKKYWLCKLCKFRNNIGFDEER